MCGKRNNVNGKATHNKKPYNKTTKRKLQPPHASSLIQRCSPGPGLITFTKHSQPRGSLWNTTPTKLETQNRHSCRGGDLCSLGVARAVARAPPVGCRH